MSDALEVITRGTDSSGRPLRGTRQMFELFDLANDHMGGVLVPIQGAFNKGVSASAGTHDAAGCWDFRTWNLSSGQIYAAGRFFRDHAGAWYTRTYAEGFDPHGHMILLSDAPMTSETASQRQDYIAGRNALGTHYADTFPYRPSPLVLVYDYGGQDEDMGLTPQQDRRLENVARNVAQIEELLRTFTTGEARRDAAERVREREQSQRQARRTAAVVDRLGEMERAVEGTDDRVVALRQHLRETRADLLTLLREDPVTDGTPDDPSDDGLAAARAHDKE